MTKLLVLMGVFVFAVVVMAVLALPMTWIWNAVMPVFGLPALSYGQMFGVFVLSRLLFASAPVSTNDRE